MSKFSDFIRNASAEEREKVYAEIMEKASRAQMHQVLPMPPQPPTETKSTHPTVWGPAKQNYPGGPIYRIGTSVGAELPAQPDDSPAWHGELLLAWCEWTGGYITEEEFTDVVHELVIWNLLTK